MNAIRIALLALLCGSELLIGVCRLGAEDPATEAPTFTPEEQEERDAVLKSQGWTEMHNQFDKWLSVQSTYSAKQVEQMRREYQSRIESMSAKELAAFVDEMNERLALLLSPEVSAARNWADKLYTAKGRQLMEEKYDLTDPLAMSPEALKTALAEFENDRISRAESQTAFRKAQTQSALAIAKQQRQQAAARSPQRAGTFPTPNIPPRTQKPQRYQAPYDPMHYTIGPWGGVWVHF